MYYVSFTFLRSVLHSHIELTLKLHLAFLVEASGNVVLYTWHAHTHTHTHTHKHTHTHQTDTLRFVVKHATTVKVPKKKVLSPPPHLPPAVTLPPQPLFPIFPSSCLSLLFTQMLLVIIFNNDWPFLTDITGDARGKYSSKQ